MFINRDRGLSNTLYWFFEVRNRPMENYHKVLKVKIKKLKHFEQWFSVHTNGEPTCSSVLHQLRDGRL